MAKSSGEFPLPEPLIQHIQSFLSGKEAVRTSILSKSWHAACSTRPNLDFDVGDFRRHGDLFWKFTRKTMQRYEEMKLTVESFRLVIRSGLEKDYSMVEEVILKAIKMGTVDFRFRDEFPNLMSKFILPPEVFESKTLIRLSAIGCQIDLGKERKVRCSGLKSLILFYVNIDNDVVRDIVSNCPSIENFIGGDFIVWPSIGSVCDNLYQLHNLKTLMLTDADISASFFSDLSSKFPLLKDLSLGDCRGYSGMELSSSSLECICFINNARFCAKFNVPNLRKLNIRGSHLPKLSFETSRGWESELYIIGNRNNATFFIELNELLTCLSSSRITLTLYYLMRNMKFQGVEVLEKDMKFQGGLRATVVESLKIYSTDNYLHLLNYLFWICRPIIIYDDWNKHWGRNCTLWELCNVLEQGARGSVFVEQGLRGVYLEVFEDSLAEWRPLHWKTLLQGSSTPKGKQVRFQLTWWPEPEGMLPTGIS